MILKIYNAIMPEDERQFLQFMGMDGVSFNGIDEFIASIPENDDVIDMRLHSPGGVVTEGWHIIDKLRATGKKIIATIEGQASSMAALLLLAASERKGYRHATLLIHEAYYPGADRPLRKEDLEKLAARLEEDNRQALDFMVERTGADREVLAEIMKEDTPMGMERALELGFIHEILEPASACAPTTPQPVMANPETTDMDNKKTIASLFKAMGEALGLSVKMEEAPAAVGYVLTTQDGTELTIDKPDGEDPAVGDTASPDGEHLMPDGTTIVVADGVITEIRDAGEVEPEQPEEEPQPEEVDERDERDAKIAELQARIEELEAGQMSTEQAEIIESVQKAGGKAWLDKTLQSNYKPAARQRSAQTVTPVASKISSDLEAARARRNAKRPSAKNE